MVQIHLGQPNTGGLHVGSNPTCPTNHHRGSSMACKAQVVRDVFLVKFGFDREAYFYHEGPAKEFADAINEEFYEKTTLQRVEVSYVKAIVENGRCYPLPGHKILTRDGMQRLLQKTE